MDFEKYKPTPTPISRLFAFAEKIGDMIAGSTDESDAWAIEQARITALREIDKDRLEYRKRYFKAVENSEAVAQIIPISAGLRPQPADIIHIESYERPPVPAPEAIALAQIVSARMAREQQ